MRKLAKLFALSLLLSSSILAVTVGEKAHYRKSANSARTSFVVRDAGGVLEVLEDKTSDLNRPGYIVKLTYDINVRIKGWQRGAITAFLPASIFASTFYSNLENEQSIDFGTFVADHIGMASATDGLGNLFADCHSIELTKINHQFKPAPSDKDKVEVLSFDKFEGEIESLDNVNVKFRAHSSVPGIGAVELDISGVTSIAFKAGMDYFIP